MIEIKRYIFNKTNTIGDLLINGKFFCHTLEDQVREKGVKIKGETAIPDGEYKVKLTWSPKFRKNLPQIYNTDDGAVVKGKVRFEGVRLHGGNTEADTAGCPLIAFNTDGKRIWGSASSQMVKWFEQNKGEHTLVITNEPTSYKGHYL